MALRIRFAHDTGATLGYSIERLSDGLFYDFAAAQFSANPPLAGLIAPLPEDAVPFLGRYKVTMPTPPAIFRDGDYVVSVHAEHLNNAVVAPQLGATLFNGDDATEFPAAFPPNLVANFPAISFPVVLAPAKPPASS